MRLPSEAVVATHKFTGVTFPSKKTIADSSPMSVRYPSTDDEATVKKKWFTRAYLVEAFVTAIVKNNEFAGTGESQFTAAAVEKFLDSSEFKTRYSKAKESPFANIQPEDIAFAQAIAEQSTSEACLLYTSPSPRD